MRAVSAAIVVLAGSVNFSIGSLVSHGDTQIFVMLTGAVVGLIGLANWWLILARQSTDE